jgi:2-(1,2-epoxy-1,2-dihydrophenyl)acetyl-CoA isomerase
MSVDCTHDPPVATITISNPDRKNAVDSDSAEAMAAHINELAHDDAIRCVVLTGEGDAFCSGLDLVGETGDMSPAEELEIGLNAIVRRLLRMDKPTVARVPGAAVGAGASLATACDFVYAVEDAFFQWKFTDIGLAPDTGATYVLPRLVGTRRAIELLATAESVTAPEAADSGLINEAIPAGDFDAVVEDRIDQLANRPTMALGAAKRLVYRSHNRSLEETLKGEARAQETLIESEDFGEGLSAFLEGREPDFKGR